MTSQLLFPVIQRFHRDLDIWLNNERSELNQKLNCCHGTIQSLTENFPSKKKQLLSRYQLCTSHQSGIKTVDHLVLRHLMDPITKQLLSRRRLIGSSSETCDQILFSRHNTEPHQSPHGDESELTHFWCLMPLTSKVTIQRRKNIQLPHY